MDELAAGKVMNRAVMTAYVIREGVQYIEKELPGVQMDAELRREVAEVCRALRATCHYIYSEVSELDPLLGDGTPDSVVRIRLERIARWLGDPIPRMHRLVQAI